MAASFTRALQWIWQWSWAAAAPVTATLITSVSRRKSSTEIAIVL